MTESMAWQELSRTTEFSKFGRGVDRVTFQLPDGTVEDFYVKNERSAAAVLALTPNHDVILARQFRPGPQTFLYELPGGFIDPGEEPLGSIARELREETGYQGHVQVVATVWDDAYSNVQRHVYVATDCLRTGDPTPERTEFINLITMPLKDFRSDVLRRGLMSDVEAAYLALDHLGLL